MNTQEIELTHIQNGLIEFVLTPLKADTSLKIRYKDSLAYEISPFGSLWRLLISRQNAVLMRILVKGFIRNGCISLVGKFAKNSAKSTEKQQQTYPAIQTIIQIDGDVICKLKRSVLKERGLNGFIENNTLIRNEFLKQLQYTLKFQRRLLISLITLLTIAFYYISIKTTGCDFLMSMYKTIGP